MTMGKKAIIRGIVSLVLIIGIIAFSHYRFFYTPEYPEGVLFDSKVYLIDPQTILTSLDREGTRVFLSAPPEPEDGWPQLWPSGSFAWNQEDYLKIADALHQLIWNESLEDWHLIRADFDIDQCQDIWGRIDSARLSFYQRREGQIGVHGFRINPLHGYVEAGCEYSRYEGWATSTIDLDHVKINNVNAALSVAEEDGGREARSSVKNECRVTLLLSPDRIEYDVLSHPFTRYGWGWSVIYWPNISNADPIFEITIDPYTGKHEIP